MKKNFTFCLVILSTFLLITCQNNTKSGNSGQILAGTFSNDCSLFLIKNKDSDWGLQIRDGDSVIWYQKTPVVIEYYEDTILTTIESSGYEDVDLTMNEFKGKCEIQFAGGSAKVHDSWELSENELYFSRKLIISDNSFGGFLSSITLKSGMKNKKARFFEIGRAHV